jgi:hypothetical protein
MLKPFSENSKSIKKTSALDCAINKLQVKRNTKEI